MTTWSDAARVCLDRRILSKDPDTGELTETPDQMLQRVAWNIAGAETDPRMQEVVAQEFHRIMAELKFLPNSPALVNAGRPLQQLAACYVLPVEDSIEGIFESVKIAAMIHQTGGGTGFNFGDLRPRGSRVKSTGNVASGPVTFMQVFDAATNAIKQGGVRRGANMGVLPINHPDVREFIHLKNEEGVLTNFNVSLAVSDFFMECLAKGTPFPLEWGGRIYEYVNPQELWQEIAESAWLSGDPGVIFIDRVNEFNPTPNLGDIQATNPCGEVPLLPYHTCNLGSIDVSKFWNGTDMDWDDLEKTIHLAVRFLDNIIDVNKFPHPLIDYNTKLARKIGLGIMGWADLLIKMRVPYGSLKSLELASHLMKFVRDAADEESLGLGAERGVFPAWEGSVYSESDVTKTYRNASRTVIAPTGTLSILANCSSGIEPLFGLTFHKNVMDTQVTHVSEAAKELLESAGCWNGFVEMDLLAGKPASEIPSIPADVAMILRTAHEIPVKEHVAMQAAFQSQVDDSISKTINFHHDATAADIRETYLEAFRLGCKGITVYRDGCKTGGQVLQFESQAALAAGNSCPDCGGVMIHSEGCEECTQCGLSMCAA